MLKITHTLCIQFKSHSKPNILKNKISPEFLHLTNIVNLYFHPQKNISHQLINLFINQNKINSSNATAEKNTSLYARGR